MRIPEPVLMAHAMENEPFNHAMIAQESLKYSSSGSLNAESRVLGFKKKQNEVASLASQPTVKGWLARLRMKGLVWGMLRISV